MVPSWIWSSWWWNVLSITFAVWSKSIVSILTCFSLYIRHRVSFRRKKNKDEAASPKEKEGKMPKGKEEKVRISSCDRPCGILTSEGVPPRYILQVFFCVGLALLYDNHHECSAKPSSILGRGLY